MNKSLPSNGFLYQASLFFFSLFFVFFGWQQWWASVSPRLIRGSELRQQLHEDHLALGATLFVWLLLCFLFWLARPGKSLRSKLSAAFSNCAATAVSLFFIACFVLMLFGLSQAWSKAEETAVFGLFALPHFLSVSWQTSGYMHSALSMITVYLFSGIVFVYLYRHLRRYMQPGYAVALLMLVHLLSSMPKPPSLHPIAALGTYVLTPLIYLIALAVYCLANEKKRIYWPFFVGLIVLLMYMPYFSFKIMPPWHQAAAETIPAATLPDDIPAARPADTLFPDRQRFAEAEKLTAWCRQCHSVEKGAPHLLGPNLAGVFNRQIATAAGYDTYSKALREKGKAGTFWTRENLAAYLTDGQTFAPGNLMNQQTDLSDPTKLELALDYLESLSTR